MSDLPPLLLVVVTGAIGYLIGSLSSGYAVGKLYRNVDLRTVGSGSTGSANALRALGPGAAGLVLLLDIGKGALAVFMAQQLVASTDWRPVGEAVAGTAVVVGHCWPVTLRGRGGRGIATGFGSLLFVASPTALFAILAFGVAVALTRIVSVGSLASVGGAVAGYLLVSWLGWIPFQWPLLTYIVAVSLIVLVRHVDNIRRLLAGREPRIGERPSSS